MPVDYSIDSIRGVVLSRWSGVVTASEILSKAEQLRDDPAFDRNYSELIDMNNFEGTDVTSATLDGIIRRVCSYSLSSRHAVVAPGPAAFGIARMYQALHGEEHNFVVFHNMTEARDWLGLDRQAAAGDSRGT
jgi:hypothetical protein